MILQESNELISNFRKMAIDKYYLEIVLYLALIPKFNNMIWMFSAKKALNYVHKKLILLK